jgi:hypothetical protein
MGQAIGFQYAYAFVVFKDLVEMATSPAVFSGPNSGWVDALQMAIL